MLTIISKQSGSKRWGWATGSDSELARLARQVHAEIKPAMGDRPAHVDLPKKRLKYCKCNHTLDQHGGYGKGACLVSTCPCWIFERGAQIR